MYLLQTVLAVNLGFGLVQLVTPPRHFNDITLFLQTECPYGTVVPEDPTYKNGVYIPGKQTFESTF